MNQVFLFPLPNSTLLKKVTLPFHIFEQRYRQMVKDSIAMQIPIAVIPQHASESYQGDVCVAGIPHILATYPDGRMDIYITGTVKCKLMHFEAEEPYKVYDYRPIEEKLDVDDSYSIELESLRTLLEKWSIHFLPEPSQRESFHLTLDDPELLINYCTVFLVDDGRVKKDVMIANTFREKVQVLLHAIGPKEVSLGPFMPALKF